MLRILYTVYTLTQTVTPEMIKAAHLEYMVIRPTLTRMAEFDPRLYNDSAVNLMLGTAAQETDLGFWLHQTSGGPGKGIYSTEPDTHRDITGRYLERKENAKLREIVQGFVSRDSKLGDDNELVTNFRYATAIARIKYWMAPQPLPAPGDIMELGKYWDVHFNANARVGFPEDFVRSWQQFVVKTR